MHYSTIPHEAQNDPESFCLPGLKVEVRVVRVDCGEERIGLSFIHADFEENDEVRAKAEEAKAKKAAKKATKDEDTTEAPPEAAAIAAEAKAEAEADAPAEEAPAEEPEADKPADAE